MTEDIVIKNRRECGDYTIAALCLAVAFFLPVSSWSLEPFPFPFILFMTISVVILVPLFYFLWFRRPSWITVSDEALTIVYKRKRYRVTWDLLEIRHSIDYEFGSDAYTINWKNSPAWFSLPISSEVYSVIYQRGEELGYNMFEPSARQ